MRRLGMLVMAIILITGCNAMQSNMEEAERLWRETEKNIQKWAISTNVEAPDHTGTSSRGTAENT